MQYSNFGFISTDDAKKNNVDNGCKKYRHIMHIFHFRNIKIKSAAPYRSKIEPAKVNEKRQHT
ncbi:hypothetical protein [Chryseobacterium mucoviscidosis]|uniref:hypothetical protein n=1 Tax=Chryseobacterium mucoviscidosis TaxID=1945581 RepID=UPI0030167631